MSYIIYAVGEYPLLEQDIIYSWIQNVYRLDRLPVLVLFLFIKLTVLIDVLFARHLKALSVLQYNNLSLPFGIH